MREPIITSLPKVYPYRWVILLVFIAAMSVENNRYLPALMVVFAVLSLVSAVMVLLLRESPMIITEQDRATAY